MAKQHVEGISRAFAKVLDDWGKPSPNLGRRYCRYVDVVRLLAEQGFDETVIDGEIKRHREDERLSRGWQQSTLPGECTPHVTLPGENEPERPPPTGFIALEWGKPMRDWIGQQSAERAGSMVTLLQAAAMVNKSKRALESARTKDAEFPAPTIAGGHGHAHEWEWEAIRPYLQKRYRRPLPEQYPGDRFLRR